MKEFHILFTGIGRRIELLQAFRNAALVLDKRLKLYGADITGTAPALAYCDHVRKVIGMKEPGYIACLLNICKEDKIDLLIPTIDTDLLVLSKNKEKFLTIGTQVLISDPNMITICRDKNLTSQFFIHCGLHAPMPVNDWETYNNGFPAFIKPKNGSSTINAFKVENENDLRTYAAKIEDYIVQPFVAGKEYTVDVFCDFKGVPVSIVPRERLQIRAGEVLKTKICLDSVMIEEVRLLCKYFKPCGPLTVQLIRDEKTGIDNFIEINPRFGGGAPLSMKAGARSAEALLKLLEGEAVAYYTDIADGAIYSRFDQSVCVKEGHQTIKGVIFDLDDTLYSEKEYIYSGFKAVADYLGDPNYAELLWNNFKKRKPAIDALLETLKRDHEKAIILNVYRSHIPQIHLYPEAASILRELRSNGYKLGIITDGRPDGQRKKIKALGLDKLVDDIIITDELGGIQFRKPCDISFRIMQMRWKLPASEIVYIADNPEKDFQATQQLGMNSIWFQNEDGIYTAISSFYDSFKNYESIYKKICSKTW